MAPRKDPPGDKVAYTNARLLDPATGLDKPGGVLTDGEAIAGVGPDLFKKGTPKGAKEINCGGKYLAPGLVDIRIELGDLGATVSAAVSGGVTSAVSLPNTKPVIDDMSVVEFVARRPVAWRQLGLFVPGHPAADEHVRRTRARSSADIAWSSTSRPSAS